MLKHSDLNSPDEEGVSVDADTLPFPSIVNNCTHSGINKRALEARKRIEEKKQIVSDTENQIKTKKPISTEIRFTDAKFKIDVMSMEAPVFAISKNVEKNKEEFQWSSVDGKMKLTIIPSVLGRPTMYDKKIIVYIISCLVQRRNDKLPISKTVKFPIYDYLTATDCMTGGDEYISFEKGLDRLKTNSFKTNIKSNNIEITSLFSLIDSYQLHKVNKKVKYAEVTLSDWIFNAIEGFNVITIKQEYFKLKPLEKRLYEIARKHVGNQAEFKIKTQHLWKKTGSISTSKEFNRMLKVIIESNLLPDYRAKIIGEFTVLYQKDANKLLAAMTAKAAKVKK